MLDATPLLKLYAKYRYSKLESQHPVKTQQDQLLSLVAKATNTKFGRDHSFASIKTVEDFQKQVPLRKYENFWEEYWKEPYPTLRDVTWPGLIPYFPVSSGTTSGTSKYIPLTKEMLRSNTKAGLDVLVHHIHNNPKSKILGGLNFFLGGTTDFKVEAPGVKSGDLSGIAAEELPWWIRPRYFPPAELSSLSDWEEKIEIFARESLKKDIRMLGGVPSWMLIFIDRLHELKPEATHLLKSYFPNLELIIHGGVNFAPYYDQFQSLLSGSSAELREVYPASEGFIAIADRGYNEGLRLILDNGLFFEFVPVEELDKANPTRHWIGNVQKDVNYAVVLTTCAGVWSYIIGDTVRFVDTETPRILITGRTSYYLSAFGEHLIAEEIEDAVSTAAHTINATVSDYSVGAVYPKEKGELGGHLYVVEFSESDISAEKIEEFASCVDKKLCERNEDYEAHRSEGFGLNAPRIHAVPPGTFAAWMKSRGKLGGQNKVPRLISNKELFDNLCEFTNA